MTKKRARRANGEGSVYQRADGVWAGAITLESGKRRIVYGKTQREALEKLQALQREKHAGRLTPSDKQTVAEFLAFWLEQTVKPNVRARTYRSYEQLVRVHLAPTLGRIPVAKLSAPQIQTMLNRLRAQMAPASAQRVRDVLRNALNQAVRWELIGHNPADRVELGKITTRAPKPLTLEQAQLLLKTALATPLHAIIHTALLLGLREGELLALRWSDIDFKQGRIHVRATLQRSSDGAWLFAPPKTAKGVRVLALPESLAVTLRTHKTDQEQDRLWAAERWQAHDVVFATSVGTPIAPRNLVRSFKALLLRAELPSDTRFHDLRHTCNSLMAAERISAEVRRDILGHSDVRTTQNVYTHVYNESITAATDQLDSVLELPKKPSHV